MYFECQFSFLLKVTSRCLLKTSHGTVNINVSHCIVWYRFVSSSTASGHIQKTYRRHMCTDMNALHQRCADSYNVGPLSKFLTSKRPYSHYTVPQQCVMFFFSFVLYYFSSCSFFRVYSVHMCDCQM